jgi:hypothetical protein
MNTELVDTVIEQCLTSPVGDLRHHTEQIYNEVMRYVQDADPTQSSYTQSMFYLIYTIRVYSTYSSREVFNQMTDMRPTTTIDLSNLVRVLEYLPEDANLYRLTNELSRHTYANNRVTESVGSSPEGYFDFEVPAEIHELVTQITGITDLN